MALNDEATLMVLDRKQGDQMNRIFLDDLACGRGHRRVVSCALMASTDRGARRQLADAAALTKRAAAQLTPAPMSPLATKSVNRVPAKALVRVAPQELELTEIPFKNLPLYSYDFDKNYSPVATAFKDAIAKVDAVLFVTPEYNRSIPVGALVCVVLRSQADASRAY